MLEIRDLRGEGFYEPPRRPHATSMTSDALLQIDDLRGEGVYEPPRRARNRATSTMLP